LLEPATTRPPTSRTHEQEEQDQAGRYARQTNPPSGARFEAEGSVEGAKTRSENEGRNETEGCGKTRGKVEVGKAQAGSQSCRQDEIEGGCQASSCQGRGQAEDEIRAGAAAHGKAQGCSQRPGSGEGASQEAGHGEGTGEKATSEAISEARRPGKAPAQGPPA
jgi:hypothetical protein